MRLKRGPEFVELSVKDCGQGIHAEDLPHIFEPFYRSTTSRLQGIGGVGLGLAVAKRIAEVHGGSLHVESATGLGSRFTFRLPASPNIAPDSSALAMLVPAREEA